ncbi:MAG: aldo/keto reductase [Acidobacteriota bacterium]
MIQTGSATIEGTSEYRKRMTRVLPEHFRKQQTFWLSSIGLGTYLGHHDDTTDNSYRNAISLAIQLGCNVIDTAINYRCQRSERAIGATLKELFRDGKAKREEIVIATKGGFIPYDNAPPINHDRYIQQAFIDTGIISDSEIVARCHCLSPRYLAHQIENSLKNLGLETIDIYYIHNPEMQLEEISRDKFQTRIRAAFEQLEKSVSEGKIGFYGTATWNGYRKPPAAVDYLDLSTIVALAQEVGGQDHHFRFIQLPYSLAMPEAFTLENQRINDSTLSTVEASHQLGITVMASASIMQTRLAHNLPAEIRSHLSGLHTDAQRSIQFVRSTPGIATALVGMSRTMHVEENMHTATLPPVELEEFLQIFGDSR